MRARVMTILAVAAVLLVPGLVSAQGIADVAKREKTRLEQSKQPPKVYTNDSVGGASPSAAAPKPLGDDAKPAAAAPAPAAASPAAAAAPVAAAPAAATAPATTPQTAASPAASASSVPAVAPPRPVTSPAAAATATRPASSAPAASAPAAPASAKPASAAVAPAPVRSASSPGDLEAHWRRRAEAAQVAVDAAQSRVDQLEAEAQAATDREPPSDASAGPCAQAVEDAKSGRKSRRTSGKRACDVEVQRVRRSQELDSAIDDARTQLDAARDAQDALREEARRAGAPADWLS